MLGSIYLCPDSAEKPFQGTRDSHANHWIPNIGLQTVNDWSEQGMEVSFSEIWDFRIWPSFWMTTKVEHLESLQEGKFPPKINLASIKCCFDFLLFKHSITEFIIFLTEKLLQKHRNVENLPLASSPSHPSVTTQAGSLPSTSPWGGSGNFTRPKPAHFRPELPPEGPYSSLITGGMRTHLIYTLLVGACSEVRYIRAEPCGTRHKWTRWAQTHPAVFLFTLEGRIQHLTKRNPGSNTGTLASAKRTSKAQRVLRTPRHWPPLWAVSVWRGLNLPTSARNFILDMQASSFNANPFTSVRLTRKNINICCTKV